MLVGSALRPELHFDFPDPEDPLGGPVHFEHDNGTTGEYYPAHNLVPPYKVQVVVRSSIFGEVRHSLVITAEDVKGVRQSVASFAVNRAMHDTHVLEVQQILGNQEMKDY